MMHANVNKHSRVPDRQSSGGSVSCARVCVSVAASVCSLASGSQQTLNVRDEPLVVVLVVDGRRLHAHCLQPVLILHTDTDQRHARTITDNWHKAPLLQLPLPPLLLHLFNSLFSKTTWASRYQKGETSPNLNEARDYGVWGKQWH